MASMRPSSSKFATLSNLDNEDTGEHEAWKRDIPKRVRSLKPARPEDPVVYWESQDLTDRMCAVHCVNCIVQGPRFSANDLARFANELDEAERSLVWTGAAVDNEIDNLLAGKSNHVADDGFFSLSVIEKCLSQSQLACANLSKPGLYDALRGSQADFALIRNYKEHWTVFRFIRGTGTWWNLDSLAPAPFPIPTPTLQALSSPGHTILAVYPMVPERSLPEPAPYDGLRLNANQFFLTVSQASELMAIETALHQDALAREHGSAPHMASKNTPAEHEWPSADSGHRLADPPMPSAHESSMLDEDMQAAIIASLHEAARILPEPPNEPGEDCEDSTLALQIRLPSGNVLRRRFRSDSPIEHVFWWLEQMLCRSESVSPLAPYQLLSHFPKRQFKRLHDTASVSEDGITLNTHLADIFSGSSREQLILQFLSS